MEIPSYLDLDNLGEKFPAHFTEAQLVKAQTIFQKELALKIHQLYGGKMETLPKAGLYGMGWFGIYYTPGVSAISTSIRDDNFCSYDLSNRGNLVAVVSDSTRVLGDGNVTPPGGLGVMEGKALLMFYLGGVCATALCIDSRNKDGQHDPNKIIDFVKMVSPSFGAINLEDISQPNCYKVLDELQQCGIPVWHDDAQGTACVTLAALINALRLVEKKIEDVRIVLVGAGASNTNVAHLLIAGGADGHKIILFDSKGALHQKRDDIFADPRFYRKQDLCHKTNPKNIDNIEEAIKGADVVIGLSKPGPGTIKKEWISSMADKAIVFACANPVPEIYPYEAKKAGAYITATGRSDFPNQVNNSLGFPGILKGTLLVRATRVTDNMAIAAAHSLAKAAQDKGIHPEYIVPRMDEPEIYAKEATVVALQAIKDGVSQANLTEEEIYQIATKDITRNQNLVHHLMKQEFIKKPSHDLIQSALEKAIAQVDTE